MNELPCSVLGLAPSFGFGDRIGSATPGHVEAMRIAGGHIEPIFPQQSIREMNRTGRSPEQVMHDALQGMEQAEWIGRTGADADHLKTPEDVEITVAAGFTFFTIDPSDDVDDFADQYDEHTLRQRFRQVAEEVGWVETYRGRRVTLPTGTTIELTEEACLRAAVKYGRAINRSVRMAEYVEEQCREAGRDFEIELSIDETDQPTTLAEHYIIADQCLRRGVKLISLAPRFPGDFEKGVDYKGDLAALERCLQDHAALAEMLGPYKLSLHSGSDKLSMYPALARATEGRFHVKTAGTSYLEALRVVARHDESLFRRIVRFAREHYERDRATYHVSATLADVPPPDEVERVVDLERLYLELWSEAPAGRGFMAPGRQILHCTYGSVLTDPDLGPLVKDLLQQHLDAYTEVLAHHFARHLEALHSAM
ncbi:MAG TPA: hypothetical protein EYP14_16940 [Planctomycetaceae bacterium]|nr:hypothetical protein [Planctomycetaceae bacterium]